MNSLTKILLGALGTAALTWFLHSPMGLGKTCEADAAAPATTPSTEIVTPAPSAEAEAPATAAQVADCQTKIDGVIQGKSVNFVTGGAQIAADSIPLIETLATELKACAGTNVEVAGHTDKRGGDAANMRLSEARANAVVQALAERGVPTNRLVPKGYGETAPLDPADTQEAYTKNRRTEFKVSAAPAPAGAGGQ
jgi:OOP family OmpA-OmpF porin